MKNGYAIVELYAGPNEFYDLLKQAEDDARLNNRGLWGKCDSLTPNPTPVGTSRLVPTLDPYKELSIPSFYLSLIQRRPVNEWERIRVNEKYERNQNRIEGSKQYYAKNYSAAIEKLH